jgi:hypothetical protein
VRDGARSGETIETGRESVSMSKGNETKVFPPFILRPSSSLFLSLSLSRRIPFLFLVSFWVSLIACFEYDFGRRYFYIIRLRQNYKKKKTRQSKSQNNLFFPLGFDWWIFIFNFIFFCLGGEIFQWVSTFFFSPENCGFPSGLCFSSFSKVSDSQPHTLKYFFCYFHLLPFVALFFILLFYFVLTLFLLPFWLWMSQLCVSLCDWKESNNPHATHNGKKNFPPSFFPPHSSWRPCWLIRFCFFFTSSPFGNEKNKYSRKMERSIGRWIARTDKRDLSALKLWSQLK